MATFNKTRAPTSRKYVAEQGIVCQIDQCIPNFLVALIRFFFRKQPQNLNFYSLFSL